MLQSLVASISTNTATVSSAYTTAQASIATLAPQLSAANAQVASLTTQLATSQSSNSTLSSQLAAANAQVTTLTGQITTLNTAAASLQSQLNTANSTIATRDATIVTLNSTISTLNATIANMVATPVLMNVSSLTAAEATTITVTATFPTTESGKTATFSTTAASGSLAATSVTIANGGTSTTLFSSAAPGTFNIYVIDGLYAGGAIVTITAVPVPAYSCSGSLSPLGRWCDNLDGTVRDMTSGLIWLQDAGWAGLQHLVGAPPTALVIVSQMANGNPASLMDGSASGDWRMPTKNELLSLTAGTEYIQSLTGSSTVYKFNNVPGSSFSSSDTFILDPSFIWIVNMYTGGTDIWNISSNFWVWPVRSGQ